LQTCSSPKRILALAHYDSAGHDDSSLIKQPAMMARRSAAIIQGWMTLTSFFFPMCRIHGQEIRTKKGVYICIQFVTIGEKLKFECFHDDEKILLGMFIAMLNAAGNVIS
jgi:hypothetical protein